MLNKRRKLPLSSEMKKKQKDVLSEDSIHSSKVSSRSASPSHSSISETPDEKRLRLDK